MSLWAILKVAFRSLRKNKMRSALTMLGIIIGVGAVIAMVSIGQGANAMVQDQIRAWAPTSCTSGPAAITPRAACARGPAPQASLTAEDVRRHRAGSAHRGRRRARWSAPAPRSSSATRTGAPRFRAPTRSTARSGAGRRMTASFSPRGTSRIAPGWPCSARPWWRTCSRASDPWARPSGSGTCRSAVIGVLERKGPDP